MPTYEVTVPGRGTYSVESPNELSDKDAYLTVLSQLGAPEPVAPEAPAPVAAPEEGDFMRGVKSYFPSIQETFGGAQALAGQALGSQGITQAGIERMKKAQAEQKPKETDEFTNAWDKGIGTVLTDWLPYQIGSGVGNIAESVAMAGAGALLGGTLGGGVGAAPGAATGFLSKQLIKKGIKEAAKEIMEKQGKEAAEDYIARNAIGEIESEAAKTLARQGGKKYGMTAGIAAQAMLHGAGETTSRALQEAGYDPEQLDMSKLVPAIGVHSVADFISEKILLGGFKGMAGIPDKSTNKFVFDVLKGAAATGAKEIPPEVVQSAAERYGAKMNVGDAEAVSEYMNTAAAAFAMSMLPGGVGGARTYLGRPPAGVQPTTEVTPQAAPETPAPEATVEPGVVPPTEAAREAEAIRAMEQGIPPVGTPVEQPVTPEPVAEQPQAQPIPEQPERQAAASMAATGQVMQVLQNAAEGFTIGSQQYAETGDKATLNRVRKYLRDNLTPLMGQKDANAYIRYLIDEGGLNEADYGSGHGLFGTAVQGVQIPEVTVGEQAQPQAEAPAAEPVKAEPLPADLHPLEAMNVPGQEQAHQAAVESAKAAGIQPVLSKLTGRINPERTTVDWDKISQFQNLGGLLKHMQDHVPVDYKGIIQKILPSVKNIPINVVNSISGSPGALAAYRPSISRATGDVVAHRIEFSMKKNGNDISTILHESLHGATVSNYYRGKAGDERYAQAAKDLDSLTRKLVKLQKEGQIDISFFRDYKRANLPRELISWGQTDRDVQKQLKSVVLPNKKTAWSEFVNTMRKLLGLPANQTTALERLLDISERLTSQQDVMQRKPAGRTQEEVMTKQANPMENERFRKWFGDSKVVDEDGNPLVVYHGTNYVDEQGRPLDRFQENNGAIFVAVDPDFATKFAMNDMLWSKESQMPPPEGAHVIPVYVRAENPFDYENPKHIQKVAAELDDSRDRARFKRGAAEGNWGDIEDFLDFIQQAGFDSFYVLEQGRKNLGVFSPNQLKSLFNKGTFSPEEESISAKARREEVGPQPQMREYERQNIMGQPVAVREVNSWSMGDEEPSRWSKFLNDHVYDYVDKYVDLKKIIAAINKTSKMLDDKWDAYMRETLYHQRVRFQTKEFLDRELDPLAQKMIARGVSEEELNAYLMARHAEEYNQAINTRNPEDSALQDRGSGIHTMIAQAYLKGETPQEIENLRNEYAPLTKNEEALLNAIPKMTEAKRKALTELSKDVDSMVRKTQQIAIDGGIERKETIDYWNDLYQHYVPFKRTPEELEFEQSHYGAGKGFSTKAGMGRAATGSLKTIDNILSNIITQRDMAIVKAEKARIGRALYAMFLQHPNPEIALVVNPNAGVIGKANDLFIQIQKDKKKLEDLGKTIDNMRAQGKNADTQLKAYNDLRDKLAEDVKRHAAMAAEAEVAKQNIIKEMKQFGYDSQNQEIDGNMIENIIREPQGSFYNPNTGMVEYRTNSFLRSSPNVLAVPIDGETRYIFFNTKNPTAQRLGHALKGADVEQLGRITALVSKFTRWIASVNTQYNPFFGIVNMMRDVQGAQLNLSSTPLAGQQLAVNRHIFPAAATIWKALRSGMSEADVMKSTSFSPEQKQMFLDWIEFQKRGGTTGIRDMLVDNQTRISSLTKLLADYNRSPTQAGLLKAGKAAIEYMSNFNDTMENAVRLAAFIEAKKKFSKTYANPDVAADKAAELAKNLTVNFNRKGAKTTFVNSLYAFFNASVQGTARLAETLKGPAGKKIMGSLMLLGVIQQLMLSGFEDDDPPEFVRERNLVIPTGGGKYISIPMPLGFNIFVNAGRLATSTFMSGGDNIAKNVSNFATAVADSFSPLGGGSLVQAAAPTVLDPAVALYGNTDAFGRPIFRADRPGQPVPGYLRSTEGATDISRFLAKALNYMSGGTEFQKGEISPTADHIDYLAGQIGGGTFREARKLAEFASNQVTGEETAPYRVPLAGRFMGDTGSEANVRNKFYANVQQMASFEAEIKGRLKTQQRVDQFLTEHPEARMYQVANAAESQITKLNKLRKQLIERGASKEQLKQLNDQKIQLMKQFNDAMDKATPK